MGNQIFTNDASTTLASSITNTATTATLASGGAALFPAPTGSQYFLGTFNDASTGLLTEIVKVTNVSGNVITMVRAQEGTTGLAWNANDIFSLFVTAGGLNNFLQSTDAHGGANAVVVLTGSSNWTVPTGITSIRVERIGGGGGGGGGASSNVGSGGGGGGYGLDILAVTPGATIAYSCGGGGTAGSTTADGGAGGSTTFGTLNTTTGGSGGSHNGSASALGGNSSGSALAITGGSGCGGINAGTSYLGGYGGNAPRGGQGGVFSTNSTGIPGEFPGGGGGGGSNGNSGSVGQAGLVVISY